MARKVVLLSRNLVDGTWTLSRSDEPNLSLPGLELEEGLERLSNEAVYLGEILESWTDEEGPLYGAIVR